MSGNLESVKIEVTDAEDFNEEPIGNITYYIIDLKDIGIKNTEYGNREDEKDVYVISKETWKVYYIKGANIGRKKYYSLTNELRSIVDKKQQLNIAEDTITFVADKVEWTNLGVKVDVKIPISYTLNSVTTNNTNIATPTYVTDAAGNKIYTFNAALIAEKYEISVNYTKNSNTKISKYKVENIDVTYPTIIKNGTANTEEYLKGFEANDIESGIVKFKYVEERINAIDIPIYINEYGIDIKNGNIKRGANEYTLYAEDKAGNYTIKYINNLGDIIS
ncbi:MAG: hypothetical protein PHR25_02465 [Clostridia bacterium]|nr:hypothetical protein [Clostridia bacterium]MDD4375623.1 hypothetical protein [Clostridia bacterium]